MNRRKEIPLEGKPVESQRNAASTPVASESVEKPLTFSKTLAARLAASKRKALEVSAPETNPPAGAGDSLERRPLASNDQFKSAKSRTASQSDFSTSSLKQKDFLRSSKNLLHDIFPELLNFLHDQKRRRRRIRAYLRSRAEVPQPSPVKKEMPVEDEVKARALPKLSLVQMRRFRIGTWRLLRPIIRWQRRSAAPIVFAVYFGILCVLSISTTVYFLIPASSPNPPPRASLPPAEVAPLTLGTSRPGRLFLQDPRTKPADLSRLQSQAEEEFRAGNYAKAEALFREALPTARLRAFTGFQIFLCLLKQGKFAEAELMAGKFPATANAKNPSGQYVHAALALIHSRPEEARQCVETARREFPSISPFYDKALNDATLQPSP